CTKGDLVTIKRWVPNPKTGKLIPSPVEHSEWGGHSGVVAEVDGVGRPTAVIMCSEACDEWGAAQKEMKKRGMNPSLHSGVVCLIPWRRYEITSQRIPLPDRFQDPMWRTHIDPR